MDMLRTATYRVSGREAEIVKSLKELEPAVINYARKLKDGLRFSPLAFQSLDFADGFKGAQDYGSNLRIAAETSERVLKSLKDSVRVVEAVSEMYDLCKEILKYHEFGGIAKAEAEINKYIAVVAHAKEAGYWEHVHCIISQGHIGEDVNTLKTIALDSVNKHVCMKLSQLLTRLLVNLGAREEAYGTFITLVRQQTSRINIQHSTAGGEHNDLERIVQIAHTLLVKQATVVQSELGVYDYIRICREIHSAAGKEATLIFLAFMRSRFASVLPATAENESLMFIIEKQLDDRDSLHMVVSDVKTLDRLLDEMVALSVLWIDFETATKEHLRSVYKTLLIKNQEDDDKYGTDGLEKLSQATQVLQCILAIYVRLEYTAATVAVAQAIMVADSIYLSSIDLEGASTSTLVDDVFYVLHKAQQRSISTGDVQAACATFNQVVGIIGNDLKDALFQSLMDSQPIYGEWVQIRTNLSQGSWYTMLQNHFEKLRQPLPERISSKYSFIHSLNNIEECINCITEFQKQMLVCFQQEFANGTFYYLFMNARVEQDRLLIESTVQALDTVKAEFDEIHDTACNYALNMLKIYLSDPLNLFGTINFNMTEEVYNGYKADDVFVQQITGSLELIFKHLQNSFAPQSKTKCMNNLLERICKFIEVSILASKFSIYGALYFDRVVRQVMSSCTALEQQTRKQFTRLLHISDVLNAPSADELVDVAEIYGQEFVEQFEALKLTTV